VKKNIQDPGGLKSEPVFILSGLNSATVHYQLNNTWFTTE